LQAYSFRKVIPELSADYHVVAFDWLGLFLTITENHGMAKVSSQKQVFIDITIRQIVIQCCKGVEGLFDISTLMSLPGLDFDSSGHIASLRNSKTS
jgi:hypothetical protein